MSAPVQVYHEGTLYWVCTSKERAVLDACAKLDLREHPSGITPVTCYDGSRAVELAEWGRRKADKR